MKYVLGFFVGAIVVSAATRNSRIQAFAAGLATTQAKPDAK